MKPLYRLARSLAVVAAAAAATVAGAQADPADSDTAADEAAGFAVRTADVPGSSAKGVWAEKIIEAPATDVEAALLDVAGLPRFMPYVREARGIPEAGARGSMLVHALLDLPLIGQRDYVVALQVKSSVGADGRGRFHSVWRARPERLPLTPGVLRFERNEGSWTVVALEDASRCRVLYHFVVDPGGGIPGVLLDAANEAGLRQTFAALQREAARRELVRRTGATSHATPRPGSETASKLD